MLRYLLSEGNQRHPPGCCCRSQRAALKAQVTWSCRIFGYALIMIEMFFSTTYWISHSSDRAEAMSGPGEDLRFRAAGRSPEFNGDAESEWSESWHLVTAEVTVRTDSDFKV